MPVKFSAEIIDEGLFRASEKTDGTSDFDSAALRYLNRGYHAIILGGEEYSPIENEPWLWLRTDGILRLDEPISAGTVSVSKDSATITFSSAPSVSVQGWHFKVDDFSDVFIISSHVAGSPSASLDSAYTGPTNASASYRLMHLDYSMPSDLLRLIEPLRVYQSSITPSRRIVGMDINEFHRIYPLNFLRQGVPTAFAFVSQNKVRFNAYGLQDNKIRVDFQYLKLPQDLTNSPTEEPLVPYEHRSVLADIIAYHVLLDKNDDRSAAFLAQAKAKLAAMVKQNRDLLAQTGEPFRFSYRPGGRVDESIIRTETGMILG